MDLKLVLIPCKRMVILHFYKRNTACHSVKEINIKSTTSFKEGLNLEKTRDNVLLFKSCGTI